MNREKNNDIPELSDIKLLGIDTDAEWNKFCTMAGINRPKTLRLNWLWKAAAVILIAGTGIVGYNAITSAPKSEIFTADNTAIETTVETATHISINRNSSITCTDGRKNGLYEVKLQGEAYFDVEKNPNRTFKINTQALTVTVHGTSFNVKENSDATTVTVTSGKVEVTSHTNGKNVANLTKGMQLTCSSDGEMTVSETADLNTLAWKTRKLDFQNSTLDYVMEQISTAYGIQYTFQNEALKTETLTGKFDAQDLEQVIMILEQALEVKITRQEADQSYLIAK